MLTRATLKVSHGPRCAPRACRARAVRPRGRADGESGASSGCGPSPYDGRMSQSADHTSGKKVLLAAPRGYCAGVDRAVVTVEKALELYGPPVYVRKQIVHNKHV